MTKHIGLYEGKKIIIVLHKLEAEPHMCLILHVDKLPSVYRDTLVAVLNSETGQAASDFATVLDSVLLPDGRPLAKTLHHEGQFKKVSTEFVFVTIDSVNKIKLSQLNEYLDAKKNNSELFEKMRVLDEQSGYKAPATRSQVATPKVDSNPLDLLPSVVTGASVPANNDSLVALEAKVDRISGVLETLMEKLATVNTPEKVMTLPKRKPGRPAKKSIGE